LIATASDGEEAVALAAGHQPQVVLMDLRMPRLDGIEATRLLRERCPEGRVIALTAYADDAALDPAVRHHVVSGSPPLRCDAVGLVTIGAV
jgi:CheY-like chemotaxis protein